MAQTINKSVELIKQAQDIERFTSILPRKYTKLETHRTFASEEHWLTVEGSVTVTDELSNESYQLTVGDILICPVGSRLKRVKQQTQVNSLINSPLNKQFKK